MSSTKILAYVLDEWGMEYTILSDTKAELFGKINVTELTIRLAKEHCEVKSMQEKEESLESYYIR